MLHDLTEIISLLNTAVHIFCFDLQSERQNFILLNSTIYNVFVNAKPDIIEDLLDIVSFFQHFQLWKILEEFKPNVRPILNLKLASLKPATIKMRRLIIK